MRRYDVIAEICDAMQALGWGPYQNDHEDANGQFEMNWHYDDALITADRHAFFKYMVKSIAEKHGLRATFMPKPFAELTGNGCHAHVSLWAGRQEPVRRSGRASWACRSWAITSSAASCTRPRRCARLQPDGQLLQAHQRAGDALGRDLVAEHRHLYRQQPHPHDPHPRARAASSCGWPTAPPIPICCRPAILAAGLDGIANKRDPGQRLDINMYTEGHKVDGAKKLPLNLLDALAPPKAPRCCASGWARWSPPISS